MRRIPLLLAAVLFAMFGQVSVAECSVPESGAQQLNLQEAVQTGLERNQRVQAMEFGIERSQSQVKSARGRFLPRMSAGYSRLWVDTMKTTGREDSEYLDHTMDTWRISLVQTLYAGKTILSAYQRARIQEEISVLEKETEERRLIRWIQEQFLLLLKAREDQHSLEQTLERLQVSLNAAESFASRQLAPYVAVLQSRVELEEARQRLEQTRNMETIYKTRLDALLNISDSRESVYVGDLSEINLEWSFELEECMATAERERTDLAFIMNNIRMVGKDKDIARGQKMPRVNLEVSAVDRERNYDQPGRDIFNRPFSRDQENRYWTVGLNVEWHFFSGGESYYHGQSMDYEMKRLQHLYDDALSNIRTEVRSAWLRLDEAQRRIAATKVNVETALEGYRMEEYRLKQRVGTIQELLNAQDRLARAEANRNQAMLDYQLALADLFFAMGVRNPGLN